MQLILQDPDELFETLSQCLLSGVDRDALSGWGGIVYVMCAILPPACHQPMPCCIVSFA